MKFALIASHPNLSTGYAKVATGLANEISKYHEITYLGFQNTESTNINRQVDKQVTVHDLYNIDPDSPLGFGDKAILPILNIEKPDIVIIYNDHGVCASVLKIIQQISCKKWCYLDMVYEHQYPKNIKFIKDNSDLILIFSDSWKEHLNKTYGVPANKMYTLYHGISDVTPTLTRKDFGFKEDDFIILSLNRNDSRKNLDIVLLSFLLYYKACQEREKLYLFLNCKINGYLNIIEYIEMILEKLNLDNECLNHIKISPNCTRMTDEQIHSLYNISDIGISITSGEGFGLTVFEHLKYNKPVICSRLPIFEEHLGKDYPFFVDSICESYSHDILGGFKKNFRIEDCLAMLNKVCFNDFKININFDYLNWEKLVNKMLLTITD